MLALALAVPRTFAAAAPPPPVPTQEQIDAAIAKGQAFLLSQVKAPGRWEFDAKRDGNKHDHPKRQGSTWGGYTAIATYALLASGKSPQDKDLEPAIKFLKTADITGAYALGLRAQVWAYLPRGPETLRLYKQDADALLRTINTRGQATALWDYADPSNKGNMVDHSVSQYGVLGLWACAQGGVEINAQVWSTMDAVWRKRQYSDGGWSYNGEKDSDKKVTHTMTAAGVATLFITQEYLAAGRGLNCTPGAADAGIERGLKWLGDNFADVNNNYLWYGIERIGASSGRKYFGDKDWYAVGVNRVLRAQKPDGSFRAGGFPGADPIADTAFALLFLARGRSPVVMNKLDYSAGAAAAAAGGNSQKGGGWNQRPRDVANVTRWIGRQNERYLNWQVVNLSAGAQDLLDAPILYVSGSDKLELSDEHAAKLRQFAEDGGLILGNADCANEDFARSFRALGKRLFPRYAFRELPASHPILAGQQFRADKWKERVSLEGLGNGSRELMLLLPADLDAGRAWQQRSDRSKEHLFQLAANIHLYAVDKRSDRRKGETHVVRDAGTKPQRTLVVARLEAGPNWDPEPGGWRRLALVMKNERRIALDVRPVKLGAGKLSGSGAAVAHLTGTQAFELDAKQRDELKNYVAGGGTLVVDAAGGASAFADAAEKQLALVFGDAVAQQTSRPLPVGHALFANPAAPIARVAYRRAASERITGDLKAPRLRGVAAAGGRLGVIVSREDLSTGLVGHAVDGVVGYDPASATAIMRNILLAAAGETKPPVAAAAKKPAPAAPAKPAGSGDGFD